MSLRFLPASLTASATLLLALLAPGRALANDCQSSRDCDQGFECQEVGTSGCATPSCPPDGPCPEAEPCEVRTQRECVPAHCTSDAECGAGMVCHEWTSGGCAASGCACSSDQPDCGCSSEPPVCEETTESRCTPKYALPCTVAADCGSNFTCEEQQRCGCSGSTGSGSAPTPDNAARPLPPEGDPLPSEPQPEPDSDCACEPSGQFACVPVEIDCDSDSNCPAGWSCHSLGVATDPGCVGDDCKAAPLPQPEPSTGRCYPSYYGGVEVDLDGGTATSGGDDEGTPNGAPQVPQAAPSGESAQDSAACQLGHAPASQSALSILAVLGALAGLSRRRAQPRG